jgi:hypothetical protein
MHVSNPGNKLSIYFFRPRRVYIPRTQTLDSILGTRLSACTRGAISIASGRVPKTVSIFMF